MTQEHPITLPPDLVRKWAIASPLQHSDEYWAYELYIAHHAARWGANQELEACCEWLRGNDPYEHDYHQMLRAARRPKPPSLKEQALEALEQIDGWAVANMNHLSIHDDLVTGVEAIRRALESLPE